jgi:hypothetical protein
MRVRIVVLNPLALNPNLPYMHGFKPAGGVWALWGRNP